MELTLKLDATIINIKHKSIKGISLIHFKNCSIQINDIEYRSKTPSYWDTIEIISTLYNDIHHSQIIEPLNIKKLNNWTIDNINEINILKQNSNSQYSKSIILGLAVSIITAYIIYTH